MKKGRDVEEKGIKPRCSLPNSFQRHRVGPRVRMWRVDRIGCAKTDYGINVVDQRTKALRVVERM